jgi:hypothetical protein
MRGMLPSRRKKRSPLLRVAPPGWIDRLTTYTLPLLPVIVEDFYHAIIPASGITVGGETSVYPTYAVKFTSLDPVIILVLAALLGALTLLWGGCVGFSERRAALDLLRLLLWPSRSGDLPSRLGLACPSALSQMRKQASG